ncbi:hypothetical protein SS05631_c33890 [Sinorhizobium sp. CCBAU 05631]|nr:hypothetical protein SS05631_c33890 [Sinorhizobium sp. CCBAU 05631]
MPTTGTKVPLKLSEAFDAVVVSPFAAPWLGDVVGETITQFGQ